MSCPESCSTDSGVRNPSTDGTLVGPGGGGGAAGGGGVLSIGLQATMANTPSNVRITRIAMAPFMVRARLHPFHQCHEPRVAAQRIEIGIVLQPFTVPKAILHRFLNARNRVLGISQVCE